MNVLETPNIGNRALNLTRRIGKNTYNLTRRVGAKVYNYTGKLTKEYEKLTRLNITRDKYTYRRLKGEVPT